MSRTGVESLKFDEDAGTHKRYDHQRSIAVEDSAKHLRMRGMVHEHGFGDQERDVGVRLRDCKRRVKIGEPCQPCTARITLRASGSWQRTCANARLQHAAGSTIEQCRAQARKAERSRNCAIVKPVVALRKLVVVERNREGACWRPCARWPRARGSRKNASCDGEALPSAEGYRRTARQNRALWCRFQRLRARLLRTAWQSTRQHRATPCACESVRDHNALSVGQASIVCSRRCDVPHSAASVGP